MKDMDELWGLPATELARVIRDRSISAREAAKAALARLEAVNPAINAVVECRPEDVLAQADAVDAILSRGGDPGPLAGVPITTKINVDQAGFATTNGIHAQQDLVAKADNPVVASLRQGGAVLLGRTNAPAFSYRWFTSNLLHGVTRNPHNPALTPGGSSGGAAAAVAAGIGAIAHGTDIAGSVRFPAYACGVHGLRPSFGRIAAYNASSPERTIGAQLMAVSGPIARTIADLRLALSAMAAPSPLDPWWVPAPLEGPAVPLKAALCVRPDGLEVDPAIVEALQDAGRRLEAAGWTVEEVAEIPPLAEAAEIQVKLWFGDGYPAMVAAAEREGDPGARAALAGQREVASGIDLATFSAALTRRATFVRQWQAFLGRYAVLIMPVCGELPFPNDLDLVDDASYKRVWRAQMPQVGLPLIGVPALTVSTGMAGSAPVGVQVVAARFREDLCLLAGEAIEAGGTPPAPIDPVRS
jgi:amidase